MNESLVVLDSNIALCLFLAAFNCMIKLVSLQYVPSSLLSNEDCRLQYPGPGATAAFAVIDDSRGASYNRYDNNNSHNGDDDEEDNYDDNNNRENEEDDYGYDDSDDDNGYDDGCDKIHDNENKIYENNDECDDICHT